MYFLTLKFIYDCYGELKEVLHSASKLDTFFYIFWLCGPFILLIERTPADAWVSTIAISFVIRSVLTRDFIWLEAIWVKCALWFWGICILSSFFSTNPNYSITEALIWFRFPIFAIAVVFWLGKDPRLVKAMFFSVFIAAILMMGIFISEIIIQGQTKNRLTWPYNDYMPGNFLLKVCLPVFTIIAALSVDPKFIGRFSAGVFTVAFTVVLALTGERMNFLLCCFAGFLAVFTWKPNFNLLFVLIAISITSIFSTFYIFPDLHSRFTGEFISQIPTGPHSDYYNVMSGGFDVFLKSPLLGIGTANYRDLCVTIVDHTKILYCDNHPHNFYIQLLAETGILGFITGVSMITSIVLTNFASARRNRDDIFIFTSFITPLVLFFPITSSSDFFGQWNNIFLWSGIALSMASVNLRNSLSG